jgi:L-ascorbate metabolism protein UlaG (beta-lactamase superfamily)
MSRLGAAVTWLGHAGFHIATEPEGPVVLIDPWLDSPKAPANATELAAEAHGVRATLVQAFHSSSVTSADGRPREVGTPCGFVIELPNGTVIYNTGDTGVFGDMALIGELYRPSILMLPIGDFYTMGAKQAAKAVALVDAPHVIPQHFGTFPGLPGTAEAFLAALPEAHRSRVLVPAPGVTLR